MLSDQERRRSPNSHSATARRPEPVRASRQEWFADEVAIDFPSVGRLVDRIRDSFFGQDPFSVPIAAEVLLTPGEAFHGATVPIDVPVRHTCSLCGGRGEVWMEACVPCAGSGAALSRHPVRLLVPAGVRDGARFRFSVTPPFAPPT